MTEAELGWVGGIIDGEGSICVERHRTRTDRGERGHILHVSVHNTDHLLLATLQRLCGGSLREERAPSLVIPSRKRIWLWRVTSLEARQFLRLIEPYLVGKRDQANVALSLPHKADRRPRSMDFIANSEAVRMELMRLHRNPHLPSLDGTSPKLEVIVGTGQQVAMRLLTTDDQTNESMEVSNG